MNGRERHREGEEPCKQGNFSTIEPRRCARQALASDDGAGEHYDTDKLHTQRPEIGIKDRRAPIVAGVRWSVVARALEMIGERKWEKWRGYKYLATCRAIVGRARRTQLLPTPRPARQLMFDYRFSGSRLMRGLHRQCLD